nr:MAG TPA: hypothetical protein [Caudoviricetes sp.]
MNLERRGQLGREEKSAGKAAAVAGETTQKQRSDARGI